jgi:hypothetical protein
MIIDAIRENQVSVQLTLGELRIVNNALNEVCNGLRMSEFSTRMGATRDEAMALLRQIKDAISRVAP